MPRIVGVDIPNDKQLWVALTYIQGIGYKRAEDIIREAGMDRTAKASSLTEDEISRISQIVDREYQVEGQLRRMVSQNVNRLKAINCYRGIRHKRGLPVRGQCTQSNARSRKGPRKTVAGKKSVKDAR